ncbi:U32 family peptidase [Candidatus Woesearchaeota archaeon]|jgi:U32 family peptidase|nr:U32 family peptidase [Candidatus Woesearchaeota archaeon]
MEILAPVGNRSMLTAAVKAKADAIYFGIKNFNMRSTAGNFELDEITEIISYCHQNNVKAYCTINIIVYESELEKLNEILTKLKEAKIDAVICWDLAVVKKCKELGISIHLSTQASVSNSAAAEYWKSLGVERIVLARECSIEDVKAIKEKTNLEIEVFVHGARCISYSGRCFMSQELFNKSANRGECLQPCRREYKVVDDENNEMLMDNNFIMSAKDLCALPILDKLTFVDCLKIEGRNRGADYVSKVVSVYRRATDAIKEGTVNEDLVKELTTELKQVYNKDFSTGFFVDYPHHQRADSYGSKSSTQKVQIGKVSNYYKKISAAEFKVECDEVNVGDKLTFIGPTTGCKELIVSEMYDDSGKIELAEKGTLITIKTDFLVRENDKVYLIRERK